MEIRKEFLKNEKDISNKYYNNINNNSGYETNLYYNNSY
jgi:hypothetical protein